MTRYSFVQPSFVEPTARTARWQTPLSDDFDSERSTNDATAPNGDSLTSKSESDFEKPKPDSEKSESNIKKLKQESDFEKSKPGSEKSESTNDKTKRFQKVRCELCPRRCVLAPGKRGRCFGRQNLDGELKTFFYGRHFGLQVDPIEKKPLYHFLPGSNILSLGTIGCNLSCKFCQNYRISQATDFRFAPLETSPEELAQSVLERRLPSVAFTYNEPVIWAEFVIDAAKECRKVGVKTVAVSNGMISETAREEFFSVLDAVNIDLKSFSPEFYRRTTGGNLEAVQETIVYIAQKTNVWLELTNLLIPGLNDDPSEIDAATRWIAENVGTEVPLHFSAFFPTYQATGLPPTPPDSLFAAAEIARKNGLRFVYCGNIARRDYSSTFCPNCGATIVKRDGYRMPENRIVFETEKTDLKRKYQGFCPECGQGIAGVFR